MYTRIGKRNGEKKPGAQFCGIVSMKHVPRSAPKAYNIPQYNCSCVDIFVQYKYRLTVILDVLILHCVIAVVSLYPRINSPKRLYIIYVYKYTQYICINVAYNI